MSLSIVLIHSDDGVRARVGRLLDARRDLVVAASVRSVESGVSAFAEQPDAVVLMQQQTATDTGRIAVLDDLQRINPEVRAVMLFDTVDAMAATAAMRSGAVGILHHEFDGLVDTLNLILSGVGVFDPRILGVLRGTLTEMPRNPLSTREREVLSCLASGLTNAEAATLLFVSRETVKTHVAHVLRKLEVEDRSAAVDKATRIGLLA